jgi:hypothetical protein
MFCPYMDPLQWSWRYYLCQSIQKVGFEQGWGVIREHVKFLSQAFLGKDFPLTDSQCHLFYLQMLAEFGDFRSFSDPLEPPSPEILKKITRMRRSELRHELIMINTQVRYNNYILKHHGQPITKPELHWRRSQPRTEVSDEPGFLVHLIMQCKNADWAKALPGDGKGPYGLKNMTLDTILSRCVAGVVRTPMELMRDIFHYIVNTSLGKLQEPEVTALNVMRDYFVEKLRPHLQKEIAWERVGAFVQGTADDE